MKTYENNRCERIAKKKAFRKRLRPFRLSSSSERKVAQIKVEIDRNGGGRKNVSILRKMIQRNDATRSLDRRKI